MRPQGEWLARPTSFAGNRDEVSLLGKDFPRRGHPAAPTFAHDHVARGCPFENLLNGGLADRLAEGGGQDLALRHDRVMGELVADRVLDAPSWPLFRPAAPHRRRSCASSDESTSRSCGVSRPMPFFTQVVHAQILLLAFPRLGS